MTTPTHTALPLARAVALTDDPGLHRRSLRADAPGPPERAATAAIAALLRRYTGETEISVALRLEAADPGVVTLHVGAETSLAELMAAVADGPALPVAEQQFHALVTADDAPDEPPSVTLTVRRRQPRAGDARGTLRRAGRRAVRASSGAGAGSAGRASGDGHPRPAAAQRRRRHARRRGVERDRRARPGALLPRAGRQGRATGTRRDRRHLAGRRGDLRRARRGCRPARRAPAGRGHRRGVARRRVLPALRGEPGRPARLLQARGGGDPA